MSSGALSASPAARARGVWEKGRRHDAQTVDVSERKARSPVLVVAAMLSALLQGRQLLVVMAMAGVN
jgi:hypothetical protein